MDGERQKVCRCQWQVENYVEEIDTESDQIEKNLDTINREVFETEKIVYKELPPMRTGIASVFNVQELRVRLKEIKNNSKMSINFNNRMFIPTNFQQVFE